MKKKFTLIFIIVVAAICIVLSAVWMKWVWESNLPEWLKFWLLMPGK